MRAGAGQTSSVTQVTVSSTKRQIKESHAGMPSQNTMPHEYYSTAKSQPNRGTPSADMQCF